MFSYIFNLIKTQNLKVVYYSAEKALNDYNSEITTNKDQKQFLIQVAPNYHKNYHVLKKKMI